MNKRVELYLEDFLSASKKVRNYDNETIYGLIQGIIREIGSQKILTDQVTGLIVTSR